MVLPDPLGKGFYLLGVEMVDHDCDACAAELRDELGGLLDRLGTAVVGAQGSRAAATAGAVDRRAGFTQGRGNAASGASGRTCDDGHATPQRVSIR